MLHQKVNGHDMAYLRGGQGSDVAKWIFLQRHDVEQ